MLNFNLLPLICWSVFTFYGRSVIHSQTIGHSPQNVAGKIGSSVRFNASVTSASSILWLRPSLSAPVVWQPGQAQPSLGYSGDNSTGPNRYDLIIQSLSSSNAGRYQIAATAPIQTSNSAVAVAVGQMICSASTGQTTVAEDTPITLSCSVTATGGLWPTLTWNTMGLNTSTTTPAPTNMTSSTTSSTTTTTSPTMGNQSSAQVVIYASAQLSNHRLVCSLQFTSLPPTENNKATNLPSYTDSCNVSISVQYAPRNIMFYSESRNVSSGTSMIVYNDDKLICMADANPTATYTWVCADLFNGGTQFGPTLTLKGLGAQGTQGQCICTASNTYGSKTNQNMAVLTYTVGLAPGAAEENGNKGISGGEIAAAVIVPIAVVTIIIIVLVVCCCRKKRTAKMSEKTSAIPSNNPGYSNSTDNVQRAPIFPQPAQYGNVNPYPYPVDNNVNGTGSKAKGSPGMADLGVRHISAGNPDLNASIASSLQGYAGGPMSIAPGGVSMV